MIPVLIRTPVPSDEAEFLREVRASRDLHQPWVSPPEDSAAFQAFVRRRDTGRFLPWLVCRADSGAISGVVNASEVVRGNFLSAYLGYYAFASAAGRGIMFAGLSLALRELFLVERLHRIEANIQPGNTRSRHLVERLGFRREGFSPKYLKIGGEWRDHERWAMLAEEWTTAPDPVRRSMTS